MLARRAALLAQPGQLAALLDLQARPVPEAPLLVLRAMSVATPARKAIADFVALLALRDRPASLVQPEAAALLARAAGMVLSTVSQVEPGRLVQVQAQRVLRVQLVQLV